MTDIERKDINIIIEEVISRSWLDNEQTLCRPINKMPVPENESARPLELNECCFSSRVCVCVFSLHLTQSRNLSGRPLASSPLGRPLSCARVSRRLFLLLVLCSLLSHQLICSRWRFGLAHKKYTNTNHTTTTGHNETDRQNRQR